MQFEIFPQGDGYLPVSIGGLVSPEAWEQVLQEFEDALKGVPGDRLVVDLAGLLGWLGRPEREAVGALMAKRLARMRKVALVIEAKKITGVVEAAAQRNGLNLRLFPSYDEAVAWVVS